MEKYYKVYLNKRATGTTSKNAFLIGGGGTRGIFAIGILKYLFGDNPHYHLQDTDIFGGTSVGSYFATALSLGFTNDDMMNMSKIIDLSHLVDSKWLFMLTTYRFIRQGHLYDDSGRRKIIEDILNYRIDIINAHLDLPEKIAGKDLTFNHLKILIGKYPDIYRDLVINTVDINRNQQIFMSSLDDRWNEIRLVDAMMASSAIPFVYAPINMYYYPVVDQYGYIAMDGCMKCQLIDGGVSTNNPTDFFLINDKQYSNYNLWLLNFTTELPYTNINGTISMVEVVINYLVSGKNDVKMNLVQEQFKINTINLHTNAGTFEIYTPAQVQWIINNIYDQCVDGKLRLGN